MVLCVSINYYDFTQIDQDRSCKPRTADRPTGYLSALGREGTKSGAYYVMRLYACACVMCVGPV